MLWEWFFWWGWFFEDGDNDYFFWCVVLFVWEVCFSFVVVFWGSLFCVWVVLVGVFVWSVYWVGIVLLSGMVCLLCWLMICFCVRCWGRGWFFGFSVCDWVYFVVLRRWFIDSLSRWCCLGIWWFRFWWLVVVFVCFFLFVGFCFWFFVILFSVLFFCRWLRSCMENFLCVGCVFSFVFCCCWGVCGFWLRWLEKGDLVVVLIWDVLSFDVCDFELFCGCWCLYGWILLFIVVLGVLVVWLVVDFWFLFVVLGCDLFSFWFFLGFVCRLVIGLGGLGRLLKIFWGVWRWFCDLWVVVEGLRWGWGCEIRGSFCWEWVFVLWFCGGFCC